MKIEVELCVGVHLCIYDISTYIWVQFISRMRRKSTLQTVDADKTHQPTFVATRYIYNFINSRYPTLISNPNLSVCRSSSLTSSPFCSSFPALALAALRWRCVSTPLTRLGARLRRRRGNYGAGWRDGAGRRLVPTQPRLRGPCHYLALDYLAGPCM